MESRFESLRLSVLAASTSPPDGASHVEIFEPADTEARVLTGICLRDGVISDPSRHIDHTSAKRLGDRRLYDADATQLPTGAKYSNA